MQHVAVSHLKGRREPDRIFAKARAVWKIRVVAQIRLLRVERKPEASAAGAVLCEECVEFVAAFGECIDPLWLLAVIEVELQHPDTGDAAEFIAIDRVSSPNASEPFGEFFELAEADGSLEVGQFKIKAESWMRIVAAGAAHGAALIFQFTQPLENVFVVGDDHAALAGGDCFVRRKREAAGPAKRAEAAIFVARAERFSGVFDNRD